MIRAQSHGLTGWAKNLSNGGVVVVAQGSREQLEAMLLDLKAGPPGARVDDVQVEWTMECEMPTKFEIRR